MSNLMNFGTVLAALKSGCRVARIGWNGKGMWICLIRGDQWIIPAPPFISESGDYNPDGCVPLLPFIGMYTADGKFVPWLASQTDILAEDWIVIK